MKPINLAGKTIGRLTVLDEHRTVRTKGGTAKVKWLCRCTCGNLIEKYSQDLIRKQNLSCGCWKKEILSELKTNDLTGKRFNRLTVLRRVANYRDKPKWLCRCDCGKEVEVLASNLTSNHSKSCGCYNVEQAIKNATKHEMYGTRLYKIWQDMKRRCESPVELSYKNYGGRGIKVCQEWSEFQPFMDWALNNGYQEDLTIDRINVNGNYEPNNCKWSTLKEQARNKRNNYMVSFNGETKPLATWCEIFNLNYNTVYMRLKKYRWSVEEAFGY